jgi:hypothetical protein
MWIRILGSAAVVVVFAFVSQLITFAMFLSVMKMVALLAAWGVFFSIIAAVHSLPH